MDQNSDHPPKSLLRTWRYFLFWVSSLFSNIGTWMQQIAQPWVVLNLSNSAFWVGLDSFALNSPGLLFTLLGGVIADRFNRRKVVYSLQAIQFLCVLAMVVLLVFGWLKVWMIVIISFIVGLTDSLSVPSFQSIIPSLVKQADIHRAVSLNSAQFNLSRVLGPAIAGIVIVRFGAVACFSANAASYIPFFLSLYFIYPRGGFQKRKEPIETKPIEEIREIRKLFISPAVRWPLITALATNVFCGPLITFCSVLIKNVFHAQVGNFGGAMAAFGLGGLVGAGVSFISLPESFKRNILASITAMLLGVLVIIIGFNHSLPVLMALLVFAGAALTTSNISVNAFLQENANNNIRGRVASMYQLSLSGGLSIGALVTGFLVSRLNISTALMINGALALLLQTGLLWIQLRKFTPN